MTSRERGITTFRALLLVSVTFFIALAFVVYLILGITSLLMFLFPWSP